MQKQQQNLILTLIEMDILVQNRNICEIQHSEKYCLLIGNTRMYAEKQKELENSEHKKTYLLKMKNRYINEKLTKRDLEYIQQLMEKYERRLADVKKLKINHS